MKVSVEIERRPKTLDQRDGADRTGRSRSQGADASARDLLEYRPYRAFDTTQTSELILQLFGGVDIPSSGTVVYPPGAPHVDLDPVYSLGVRLVFDWRRYY